MVIYSLCDIDMWLKQTPVLMMYSAAGFLFTLSDAMDVALQLLETDPGKVLKFSVLLFSCL